MEVGGFAFPAKTRVIKKEGEIIKTSPSLNAYIQLFKGTDGRIRIYMRSIIQNQHHFFNKNANHIRVKLSSSIIFQLCKYFCFT